jgi:putative endonuclease
MYTVYIIRSSSHKRYYVGSTHDLPNRLREHNNGESASTRFGVPWELVHSEEFPTRADAVRRERMIKARGIERYLTDINKHKTD